MPSVKENLIAARALIDTPEKWAKGRMSGHGCFCAFGAIAEITRNNRSGLVSDTAEHSLLQAALPDGFFAVPAFNDAPTTTHDDIMALFDRAIEASP